LGELIRTIHKIAPRSITVCLSQYGEPETVREAVLNGVRGFFMKEEVMMELASALILALHCDFVITRGMETRLQGKALPIPHNLRSLPSWKPDPLLDPRHLVSLWLHIVYGMSASLAAQEIGLKESTVNKYISEARSILKSDWLDLDLLSPEGEQRVSIQDLTFLLFTQIPEEN
jgi:DNA-binding NarL/FixJ family response regulator